MEDNSESKLVELKKERESFRSRVFLMMLEIAVVFLVPAIIAAVIGRRLDGSAEGYTYTLIALACSFVFSWIIVIVRYRHASQKLASLSKTIAEGERVSH